jgi:hypothetical protein
MAGQNHQALGAILIVWSKPISGALQLEPNNTTYKMNFYGPAAESPQASGQITGDGKDARPL